MCDICIGSNFLLTKQHSAWDIWLEVCHLKETAIYFRWFIEIHARNRKNWISIIFSKHLALCGDYLNSIFAFWSESVWCSSVFLNQTGILNTIHELLSFLCAIFIFICMLDGLKFQELTVRSHMCDKIVLKLILSIWNVYGRERNIAKSMDWRI